jgi:glycosyltransferase involved in cell wall biosynthesis
MNLAENLLERWNPGIQGPMRIGLSGFNSATGLGYQNRDLVDKLPIASWLIVEHPSKPSMEPPPDLPVVVSPIIASEQRVLDWLGAIDCLLFYEQPLISDLPRLARQRGIAVVCIANWEWLNPDSGWIDQIDAFVCPNRHTFDLLTQWKAARGAVWKLEHVPAPVDINRFRPMVRTRCESFLFINGQGGVCPYFPGWIRHRKGPPRKGLDVVLNAAKQVPDIPVLIRSQVELPARIPRNVTLLPPVGANHELFGNGDVAIQPSYFEGTGLQMIETLASGMPLVSTDAAPMNELPLFRAIRCTNRLGKVGGNPIQVSIPDPSDLARCMKECIGTDITEASIAARMYAERVHSWPPAIEAMNRVLNQ